MTALLYLWNNSRKLAIDALFYRRCKDMSPEDGLALRRALTQMYFPTFAFGMNWLYRRITGFRAITV